MGFWIIRIDNENFPVEATTKENAKITAAREYVMKYPKANVDTRKVLSQYKIKARRVD